MRDGTDAAERDELEETTSTLKFATRMMKVSTDATVNVVLDPLVCNISQQHQCVSTQRIDAPHMVQFWLFVWMHGLGFNFLSNESSLLLDAHARCRVSICHLIAHPFGCVCLDSCW
jgi:hypothetical protein